MVGNRLRCDLGSRSKECIGDRSINLPPANGTPSSRGVFGSSERAASAYVTKAKSYSTLSMEKVINIQKRLRNLGIYDGKLDGIMGPQTALAIDVFKIKKGLPLDEELNDKTLDVLGLL
jgi:peptidoglycan hydrolase-like protein with peptidoglycan-binding domain